MQYLDLDSVVGEAMSISRDRDKYENVARQWAFTALMQLGTAEDEIEVCEVNVKNLLARKPSNCRQIIELACYDANGNWMPHRFRAGKKRIFPSTEVIAYSTDENGEQVVFEHVDVSEDRNNIVLGTNGSDVASVKIRFFSYPLDNKGYPMIREDEKLAVMFYIRFMIALEKDDNQSKIMNDEIRWKSECDRVRAAKKASSLTADKAKTISRDWMRMIPSFNFNKF